jgi:hypothetical protein
MRGRWEQVESLSHYSSRLNGRRDFLLEPGFGGGGADETCEPLPGVNAIHGESSTFRGMKIDLSDFYALDRPGSPQLGPLRRME